MSALAGIWRFDGKPDPIDDCVRMLSAQYVYGPHDGNQWSDGRIALGRRLFRTVPEDLHDHQPLQCGDSRLTLVADLRLDNRDDLVRELGWSTGRSRNLCDAEILLESLYRWGENAVDRLVGPFAFAVWNPQLQEFMLARDFGGQRPLHYYNCNSFFAFASMAKGLHAIPEIPCQVDEDMVAQCVALLPEDRSRCFFKSISSVEPGHIVSVTRRGVSHRRYWKPMRPGGSQAKAKDYVEGLRHHLNQATHSMLRGAEGLVGTHLSGGLDSSAVAATAARLLAPSGGSVIAFTSVPRKGYQGANPRNCFGDESQLAAATASLYMNIEHVLIRSSFYPLLDMLDRYFFLCERPAINPCNMGWGRAIDQAARARNITVLLTGQMGNLTISYDGVALLPELLRSGHLFKLWGVTAQLIANTNMRWRGALVKIFGPYVPVGLWQRINRHIVGNVREVEYYTAIRGGYFAAANLDAVAIERKHDVSFRPRSDSFASRLWAINRRDPGTHQKGTLAGSGIDHRDPTADRRLVEYCLSIPTEEYLFEGVPRGLARRAFADRLPQAVLKEQKKGYQAVDWHENLTAVRLELAAELDRLNNCSSAVRLLDVARLKRLVDNWPTSGWERYDVMRPYRRALMRGVAAGRFLRKASGANE